MKSRHGANLWITKMKFAATFFFIFKKDEVCSLCNFVKNKTLKNNCMIKQKTNHTISLKDRFSVASITYYFQLTPMLKEPYNIL